MTDEPVHAGPKNAVPPSDAEPDEDRVRPSSDETTNLAGYYKTSQIYALDAYPILTALAVYSKAFLETLARRHADGLADRVRMRLRKNGKDTEAEIGLRGGASATVVVTGDLPDEAGSPCSTWMSPPTSCAASSCDGTAARQPGGPLTTSRPRRRPTAADGDQWVMPHS